MESSPTPPRSLSPAPHAAGPHRKASGPRPAKKWVQSLQALGEDVKLRASDLLESARQADRFTRYKAAVVAAWVALSAVSVAVAVPSAQQRTSSALAARAYLQREPLLGYTALYLENAGAEEWRDVVLKLDSAYLAEVPHIPAGRSVVLELRKFATPTGRVAPENLRPRKLEIRCHRGREKVALGEPR